MIVKPESIGSISSSVHADVRRAISLIKQILSRYETAIADIVAAGGIRWANLDLSHSKLSDIPDRKHSYLQEIEGATNNTIDTARDKHIGNADYVRWNRHVAIVNGNPHGTDHSMLDSIEQADDTSADATGGKHVTDALVKKYEDHRNASTDVHGVGAASSVVGTATSQTLSNKTLDSTNKYGGATNYVSIDDNGILVFNGSAHLIHGTMGADNISQSVTVSATDTYYPLAAGLSDGGSAGFTFQNASELKCTVAGKYLVRYSCSLYTAAAAQEIETEVMVNTTAMSNTSNHNQSVTANKPISLSGGGRLTLAVDDIVRISASNHTSVQDIIFEHVTFEIFQVGGPS